MSEASAEEADEPDDRPQGLVDTLKAIAADYGRASTNDERRALGREQLMEVALHLQRQGVPSEALRPFTAVVHALIDVDRGRAPPILRTRWTAGGRPVPMEELRQRGLAAAAVTLFMRDGEARGHGGDQALDRAARKVARRVERWRAAQGRRAVKTGGQSLPEAVKDWRERAMRGGGSDADWDAGIYASVLELADNGPPPAELAEWALAEACKLYR